jgi:hypothetical protein
MNARFFAEDDYELALERGALGVEGRFFELLRAGRVVPDEWPGTSAGAANVVSDLLRATESAERRRRILVLAYCGARLRWRQLMRDTLSRSGVRRCMPATSSVDEGGTSSLRLSSKDCAR